MLKEYIRKYNKKWYYLTDNISNMNKSKSSNITYRTHNEQAIIYSLIYIIIKVYVVWNMCYRVILFFFLNVCLISIHRINFSLVVILAINSSLSICSLFKTSKRILHLAKLQTTWIVSFPCPMYCLNISF